MTRWKHCLVGLGTLFAFMTTPANARSSVPFEIRIVESPADAAHAARLERKADLHHAQNLQVQNKAAKAGEDQVAPTWISGIFSALGFLLLIGTLWETRKTAKAAADSVREASRSASAAEQAVSVTQEMAVRELRAYAFIMSAKVHKLAWRKPVAINLRLKNEGQTPAGKLKVLGDVIITDPKIDQNGFADLLNNAEPPAEGYLAPAQEQGTLLLSIDKLSWKRLQQIKAGKLTFFCFGIMSYYDIFQQYRETKFRFIYYPQAGDILVACDEGNDWT